MNSVHHDLPPVLVAQHSPRRARRGGFSLPEVAIAVAIAALGLLTLLGIIPSGLDSIRFAGETTAEARVVSQVVGEIQLSDWGQQTGGRWSNLEALLSRRWYYDDQANPIDRQSTSETSFQNRLAYVVRVRQSIPLMLPGATAPHPDMQNIIVDVAVSPDPGFDFGPTRTFRSRPALVTRQFSSSIR